MSLRVIKPGFLSTLQDLGRWGFQSYGVPVSGAMDTDAMTLANILVGNDEGACVIEFTLHGAELITETDVVLAFCGGGAVITINNMLISFGKPVFVRKGAIIQLQPDNQGCRSYLAIAGGFHIKPVLNSASTYLPSAMGGLCGKALQAGDLITGSLKHSLQTMKIFSSFDQSSDVRTSSWSLPPRKEPAEKIIRVIKGNEWNWIDDRSYQKFFNSEFTITPSSNRIGFRLEGEKLQRIDDRELLSTAVTRGTVQNTADGNCILLMADCQTTGGYPRIAQVAATDLSRCAQCRIGDRIRFRAISFDEAEQLFLESRRSMQEIRRGIARRLEL